MLPWFRHRATAAHSDDGSQAGDGTPLQRSMSLGSNAGFNADSQYEYRPQPLLATQGLRWESTHVPTRTHILNISYGRTRRVPPAAAAGDPGPQVIAAIVIAFCSSQVPQAAGCVLCLPSLPFI